MTLFNNNKTLDGDGLSILPNNLYEMKEKRGGGDLSVIKSSLALEEIRNQGKQSGFSGHSSPQNNGNLNLIILNDHHFDILGGI